MDRNVKQELLELVADYKEISVEEIEINRPFTEMGLDSLDVAELVMNIEEEFGVAIELSADLNTVEKLVEYIEEQL
jgi:acyl carrier protein